MAADRCITADDGSKSSFVKIAKNRWLIAAAAGEASCCLAVRLAVRKGAWSIEDLIEHVDAGSSALVLLPSGAVHRIEEGIIWPAAFGLQAIGSGGDLALGYLSAHERLGGILDRDMARLAFAFVAKRRSDCGMGVDYRSFSS